MKTLHLLMIGVVIMLAIVVMITQVNAELPTHAGGIEEVFLTLDKYYYLPGDVISVKGQVYLNATNVNMSLEKNNKLLIITKDFPISKNGTFYANFTIPVDSSIKSLTLLATVGGGTLHQGIHFISDSIPPLEQFWSGIPTNDIQCKSNLILILKTQDKTPSCVQPDTASILIERGWGTTSGLQTFFTLGSVPNSASPGNHTLPASFMPCDTPYSQNYTGIPALYMHANSTGKICVRYHNLNDSPVRIGIRISDANLTSDTTDVTTWNDSGNNTIPKDNSTVVYWIKTGDHKGLYGLTIFCVPMPLAVGYDNATLVQSDFPWLGGNTWFCPAELYDFHIDSTTGINVKYIPVK